MKKSIFTIILSFLFIALFMVGCTSSDATKDEATKQDAAIVDKPTKAVEVQVGFNAFTNNDIEYQMILEKKESGKTKKEKVNSITFTTTAGKNISDVISDAGYKSLKIDTVLGEFEGFMEYKVGSKTDESGNVLTTYEKNSGDKLYSVDEVLAKSAPDYSVVFVAKWKGLDSEYYAAHGM
ncbi:MAG: hypothetical protein IKB73_00995 [Ruminococcus sp.]|nr:hypothetical protein [Ruminococcus sp.]